MTTKITIKAIEPPSAYEVSGRPIARLDSTLLQRHVFQRYVSVYDLASCAQVCKFWKERAETILAEKYQAAFFPSVPRDFPSTLKARCNARRDLIIRNLEQRQCVTSVRGLFTDKNGMPLYKARSCNSSRFGSLFFVGADVQAGDHKISTLFRVCLNGGADDVQKVQIHDMGLEYAPQQTVDGEIIFAMTNVSGCIHLARGRIERIPDQNFTTYILRDNRILLGNTRLFITGESLVFQEMAQTYIYDTRTGILQKSILHSDLPGIVAPEIVYSAVFKQKLCVFKLAPSEVAGHASVGKLSITDLSTDQEEFTENFLVKPNVFVEARLVQNYAIVAFSHQIDLRKTCLAVVDLKKSHTRGCFGIGNPKSLRWITLNKRIESRPLRVVRSAPEIPSSKPAPEGTAAARFEKMLNFFHIFTWTQGRRTRIFDLSTGKHLDSLHHNFEEFYWAAFHNGLFMVAGNRAGRTIQDVEVFDFASQSV